MRNYRTGLLKVTRFAQWATINYGCSEAVAYTRSPEFENFYKFSKSFPVVAAPLTPTIKRFEKNPFRLIKEIMQTVKVPSDTVVVIIPAQLGIQLSK